MAYIGKTPVIGNFQKCDSISVVNGQAAYTLQVGGVNVSPQSENHMLVSLNGILQAPVDSFTVSGSTLTFASNLVTGDVIDFVMILGNVLDLGVPSDNTVSLAKLTATGTKDATTFLRGDNTFAEAGGGKVLQVVQGTSSTDDSTTSTSFVATSLTVSITPSSTSSKIFLIASSIYQNYGSAAAFSFFRDSTEVTGSSLGLTYAEVNNQREPVSFSYLDSPSTTSAITYKVCFLNNGGSNVLFGRTTTTSTIIAMEIGA